MLGSAAQIVSWQLSVHLLSSLQIWLMGTNQSD
jgi:hypothetical protein